MTWGWLIPVVFDCYSSCMYILNEVHDVKYWCAHEECLFYFCKPYLNILCWFHSFPLYIYCCCQRRAALVISSQSTSIGGTWTALQDGFPVYRFFHAVGAPLLWRLFLIWLVAGVLFTPGILVASFSVIGCPRGTIFPSMFHSKSVASVHTMLGGGGH